MARKRVLPQSFLRFAQGRILQVYAAKLANWLNGDEWFVWSCFYRIMWATSMSASVAVAE